MDKLQELVRPNGHMLRNAPAKVASQVSKVNDDIRLVPTKIHGVLDYSTVATLLILPRILRWRPATTNLLTGAGLFTLIYSFLTRYEMGVYKVLPMEMHLGLDAASGVVLATAPFVLNENAAVAAALVSLGAFELATALMSEMEPRRKKTLWGRIKTIVSM